MGTKAGAWCIHDDAVVLPWVVLLCGIPLESFIVGKSKAFCLRFYQWDLMVMDVREVDVPVTHLLQRMEAFAAGCAACIEDDIAIFRRKCIIDEHGADILDAEQPLLVELRLEHLSTHFDGIRLYFGRHRAKSFFMKLFDERRTADARRIRTDVHLRTAAERHGDFPRPVHAVMGLPV